MPRDVDYYALLGVTRDATDVEIRERFRGLARGAHPDRAPKERRTEAEARFQELAEAVNVLTNAERRKNYDFERSMVVSTSAGNTDSDSVSQTYVAQGIVAYKELKYADAAGNATEPPARDAILAFGSEGAGVSPQRSNKSTRSPTRSFASPTMVRGDVFPAAGRRR